MSTRPLTNAASRGATSEQPDLVPVHPFEQAPQTLFDPVDRAPAMIQVDTPCCYDIKFGIDYTTPEY